MKRMMKWFVITALGGLFVSSGDAESASFGVRLSSTTWKERSLFGEEAQKAEGSMFGPTLLFRLGQDDPWGIGLDGAYGQLDNMDRADTDLSLVYNISPAFGVFADFKYLWYDYESDSADRGESISTTGIGLGLGVNVNAPLGSSGFFAFGSMRAVPMSMETDVPDADGTSLLWAYEGGFAYGTPLDLGASDSSIYFSLGYRQQQLKGGEFDETTRQPFAEIGFKQEF
ncbi:MAG: hypothetical protein V1929_12340 [bacterium]